MSTLSFSVFLEKLLDGSKTQTIREYKPYYLCECGKKGPENWSKKHTWDETMIDYGREGHADMEKTTRLEVGDVVDLWWKQRSKNNKKLFQVKITEAFKITLCKNRKGKDRIWLEDEGRDMWALEEEEFIGRDGFDSIGEFWNFFNSHYNLSKPMEFVVYRWRKL